MCQKGWYRMLSFGLLVLLATCTYGFSPLADPSLVAWWGFDEGTGTVAADGSGNGHDGTLEGGASWVPGVLENALSFNGDDAYVSVEQSLLNDLTGFTLAGWVNTVNTGTYIGLFGQNDLVEFGFTSENGGQLGTWMLGNGWEFIGAAYDFEYPSWHHVVLAGDAARIAIYVDGEEVAGGGGMAAGNSSFPFRIGAYVFNEEAQAFEGEMDDVWVFSRALNQAEIQRLMLGAELSVVATDPQPEDEAVDVVRGTGLSWAAGPYAVTHDVYLGTSWADVNEADTLDNRDVLLSTGEPDTSINPQGLAFDTTYYWRVDEVNGAPEFHVHKGDVWSFTTEPFSYPLVPVTVAASSVHSDNTGPEKTIDGSGLDGADLHGVTSNDMWLTRNGDTDPWIQFEFDRPYQLHEMWVWNSNQGIESFIGFGAKDVTIELSIDGTNWTALADVPPLARAPGQPGYAHNTVIDFEAQTAKWVRISIHDGWGILPQYGLSEVRFYYVATYAREPQPADGETLDSVDVTLHWRAGRRADTHKVILSPDRAAVESGTAVIDSIKENSYTPKTLTYGTEYFWRIDEVNALGTPAVYPGDIWHFLAPEYRVIDDFDGYQDQPFLEIWAFWADGYNDDDNGALVGNGNIGETGVVYEGSQSMPIHFDNSSTPVSEVTRSFDPALNWLKGEPNILSLQVHGDAPAFIEEADGTLIVGAAGVDIWDTADEFRYVYKQLNGDGSLTVKVEDLAVVHDWTKAGVMIRESLTPEAAFAFVCSTGANGTRYQYRLQSFVSATDDQSVMDGIQQTLPAAPVWLKIEREGNAFNGYYTTDEDGSNWVAMGDNPVAITMVPNAYIGLAVTSHSAAQSTAATFSNVTTSGAVSGTWTEEAIGGTHPDNDAAPLYLVVRDTLGGEKRVSHPTPEVTILTTWEAWQIPLSDLAPLNLTSVASITIGIGEPGVAPSGAKGKVFIDSLQVGTPRE